MSILSITQLDELVFTTLIRAMVKTAYGVELDIKVKQEDPLYSGSTNTIYAVYIGNPSVPSTVILQMGPPNLKKNVFFDGPGLVDTVKLVWHKNRVGYAEGWINTDMYHTLGELVGRFGKDNHEALETIAAWPRRMASDDGA